MRTSDNNQGNYYVDEIFLPDLKKIGNKNLQELIQDNPNILVFPNTLYENKDEIDSNVLFEINETQLITNNMMGYIGVNDTQLSISSRFYPEGNDYFLHYMLQKVFAINLLDLKVNIHEESIWDIFLIYLFPYFLKKALNQGLYKEYLYKEYNDANIKGAINIARHIRINYPFIGKVAYHTREQHTDNRITQLIRHTVEFIRNGVIGRNVLNSDNEIRDAINVVCSATASYCKNERKDIIRKSIKNINHPFYTEYEILRIVCLQILRREGLTYGKHKDKVYGIIFDGAWLWEEYLNKVLSPFKFIHPENKTERNPVYLMGNSKYPRYPDFYHLEKKMVLDAKYKHLEYSGEIDRNDMHQIISYMYILKSTIGGFLFPYISNSVFPIGELNGYNGAINRYGLLIPKNSKSFVDFIKTMNYSEKQLTSLLFKN